MYPLCRVVRVARESGPEALERRTLLSSVGGLSVVEFALPAGGVELRVTGTGGDDSIAVLPAGAGVGVFDQVAGASAVFAGPYRSIRVDAGDGNDHVEVNSALSIPAALHGGAGDDVLSGGAGADRLYGGDGADVLSGGDGDDVLVTLGGGAADVASGGLGRDSFWLDKAKLADGAPDVTPDETLSGSVHRVGSFYASAALPTAVRAATRVVALDGADLPDPLVSDPAFVYHRFADHPLFSDAGPSGDDVVQGSLGDCYFLSVLLSTAELDPTRIRDSVVDLGDGTYAVQFGMGKSKKTVRVDADLPLWIDGETPAYAGLGADGSMWVAVMEKAYATYRKGGARGYAGLDAGWMRETYNLLGSPSRTARSNSSDLLIHYIQSELAAGRSVTYATSVTPSAGAPLVGGHAYAVEGVNLDGSGNPVSIRLRNPWAVDGAGDDGADDGYVTVTAHEALTSLMGVCSARV